MSGLLATSLTGLMAAQRSLETVQNNIANVNTDGYSRQQVELGANPAQFTGDGYLGQGVSVTNITRSYDQFINQQVSTSQSAFGDADNYQQLATRVDNLIADPTTGMAPAMQTFFNAVSDVANNPASIPSRQVMLSQANNVAQSFNSMNSQFEQIRTQNNSEMGAAVGNINSLASSIAALNVQIAAALGQTQGMKQPNDLLDQQDALLSKLAAIVKISVVPQKDGMSSVFIGNGQSLVQNGGSATFTTFQSQSDPGKLEVGMQTGSGVIDITPQITGGSLGGALRFRNEVLDPAQQKLGQIAAGLAMTVNAVQEKGFDLNGAAGKALFSFASPEIPAAQSPANTGNAAVTATFQDENVNPSAAANLDYSDYQLQYVNAGSGVDYTLTRLRDNQVINLTATDTLPATGVFTLSVAATQPANTPSAVLPGIDLKVDLSGGKTIVAGDEFTIRPTYSAAQNIGVNINDPAAIAAATNIEIDPVTKLPVQQVDSSNNPVFDAQGNPVYVTIKGPMPSDNSNALIMSNLQNKLTMLGGNASIGDAYGQMVSSVGSLTQASQLSSTAQKTLLTQAQGSRESLAGVNLDEEAANLVKYQQAYQASAQSISIAKSLFDTLISAVH